MRRRNGDPRPDGLQHEGDRRAVPPLKYTATIGMLLWLNRETKWRLS